MKTVNFPDDSASPQQPNTGNPTDPNAPAANEEEALSDLSGESTAIEDVGKKIVGQQG
jgi:hypothetical protein